MTDPAVEPFPGARDYPSVATVGELLVAQIARRPQARAIQLADGDAWTWHELGQEVSRIQAGLARLGVRQGDHVALLAENSLRMAAMLCALAGYGAVAVPLNTGLVGKGLQTLLEHSDAKLLVADPELIQRCRELGALDGLTCVSTADVSGVHAWDDVFTEAGDLLARGAAADTA